jgi:site-specific DNA recombinase
MSEALRLGGYVRVSQTRGRDDEPERFAAVDIQRRRIETWPKAFGHDLLCVEEELDVGGQAPRPKLVTLIERVERGELDGIVVAYASRFGRGLLDSLSLIDRIEQAGGRFVSVADGLDTSTDTGRLVLRIMLSIAEHELERIRGNWHDAKVRAVGRGVHLSATPPFGYRRDGPPRKAGGNPTGPLIVDPRTGPIVTELFRRRAEGAGLSELARWMESIGACTQWGRTVWSIRAVKDIVRNEVYVGVAYARDRSGQGEDIRNEQAHEALTDQVTFRRAQRPGVQFVPKVEPSPIRQLLRCAGCRYKVRAERRSYKSGDAWLFTCRASARSDLAGNCTMPVSIKDSGDVEAWIVERFLTDLPALLANARRATPQLDVERQTVIRDRVAFEQWRDDTRIQERLGMDAYLDGLSTRQDRLNASIAELARREAMVNAPALPDVEPKELRRRWPDLGRDLQRELLAAAVKCVFVTGSRDMPLTSRLHVIYHGTAVDLPSRGDRKFTPRPYVIGTEDGDGVRLGVEVE